jgi:large subunit GTPase 1
MRSGQGNPDEARAARYVLKDYVNGKLLFCHPPPSTPEQSFNQRTHELSLLRVTGKKRAPVTRVGKGADTFVPANPSPILVAQGQGLKSQALDQDFFSHNSNLSARAFLQGTSRNGQEFSRGRIYPHQNMVADDGTPLGHGSAKQASVSASASKVGKKHNKKNKRVKQRSGKGYD